MDLENVDKITAGAVGDPGERTFFLQAREGDRTITITVEKEQVELLASSILEILATVDLETGDGPADAELELDPPLEPLWGVPRTGGRAGGRGPRPPPAARAALARRTPVDRLRGGPRPHRHRGRGA